jgi:hypothetical protein
MIHVRPHTHHIECIREFMCIALDLPIQEEPKQTDGIPSDLIENLAAMGFSDAQARKALRESVCWDIHFLCTYP